MGTLIDKIKSWFKRKPQFKGKYTLNKMYKDNAELKRFIQERQETAKRSPTIPFVFEWNEFPADQYGKVELVRDNKVIETAKLMRSKHNLIYLQFYE